METTRMLISMGLTPFSYWDYSYDTLGQVTNGVKRLANGTAINGEQYGYSFDDIGNRKSTVVNSKSSTYSPNLLNQYTNRAVAGYMDVLGTAATNATVTVQIGSSNSTAVFATTRQGEFFFKQLSLTNTSAAVYTNLNVVGVKNLVGANGEDAVTITSGNAFIAKTPEAFTHDANGNLTEDGRWTYTWDAENRPISMTSLTNAPAASRKKIEFEYDWMSRRIQKTVSTWNGSSYVLAYTRKCVYDGWNKIAELDGTNAVVQTYMWGSDLSGSQQGAGGVGGLLAVDAGTNGVHFVAMDGNGNVSALVSAADGSVTGEYEYGPFGETIKATGTMAAANPFRFSTKHQDAESGFLYYGYRYLNVGTGRWLSRDPIDDQAGPEVYVFVHNNSINFIDSNGQIQLIPDWLKQKWKLLKQLFKGAQVGIKVRDKFIEMNKEYECCPPPKICRIADYDGIINGNNDSWTVAHRITGCELKAAGVELEAMALLNGIHETVEFFRPWAPELLRTVDGDTIHSYDDLVNSLTQASIDYLRDTVNDIKAVREGFFTDGSNCYNRFIPEECHKKK